MVIFLGAIGLLIFVGVAVVIWHAFIMFQMLNAIIHDPQTNDDDFAIGKFTDLLEQAQSNMTVYDDGNKMEGSLYMQQEVVDAIEQKLHDVPSFTLRCYFNCDDPSTLFRQAFDSEDRVDIRIGTGERPDYTHYKIIDDGRMAYLSQHRHGESKRKFQVIDCTGVNRRALKRVTDSLLGKYKKDIKQKFQSQPAS